MESVNNHSTVRMLNTGSGVTGFSSVVSFLSSGVAFSHGVRQRKIVEMTRATVQATPPSMPYAPPVNHAGPVSVALNSGFETRLRPLIGSPKNAPNVQFHDQCTPSGSQRLLVFKYAAASQIPARTVLVNVVTGATFGFVRWTRPNGTDVNNMPSHTSLARDSVCNG